MFFQFVIYAFLLLFHSTHEFMNSWISVIAEYGIKTRRKMLWFWFNKHLMELENNNNNHNNKNNNHNENENITWFINVC